MFPILKLPLLPQLSVLRNLGFLELIAISLTSDYICQLVKKLKRRAYLLRYYVYEGLFYVRELDYNQRSCLIYEDYFLAGVESENQIEKCLKTFFDMFTYDRTDICICTTEKWSIPMIVPKCIWKFRWTDGWCFSPISVECLTSLLSHEHLEDLEIDAYDINNFIYTGPMKPKRIIFVSCPSWLPLTSVYTSECDILALGCSNTTVDSVNDFVKNWIITGQPAKLARLNFSYIDDSKGFDNLLEGIETFQWEERPETFRGESLSFGYLSDVVDIKGNNGNIASCIISRGYKKFEMYSWINE